MSAVPVPSTGHDDLREASFGALTEPPRFVETDGSAVTGSLRCASLRLPTTTARSLT